MADLDFFYYTNEEEAQEITVFGSIKPTRLRSIDAIYGEGVYGTVLGPDRASEVAVLNQQGPYWRAMHSGQIALDRALHLLIPSDQLVQSLSSPSVFMYLQPLELNKYTWQVCMIPESTVPNFQLLMVEDVDTDTDDEDGSQCEEEVVEGDDKITLQPGEIVYEEIENAETSETSDQEEGVIVIPLNKPGDDGSSSDSDDDDDDEEDGEYADNPYVVRTPDPASVFGRSAWSAVSVAWQQQPCQLHFAHHPDEHALYGNQAPGGARESSSDDESV